MRSKKSRVAFSAAMAVAVCGAAAHAQVPEQRGFFGAIDGRWMWLGGDRIDNNFGGAAPTTNGPGGQLMMGFKFDGNWDVALAGGVQQMITEVTKIRGGTLSLDTNHQHVDLEVGYSQDNWRFNAGLRGLHYMMGVNYNSLPASGYDQREMYGIGPKAGFSARFALSESYAVIGGLDAALVYTNFMDSGTGALIPNGNYWQFVPQAGAELGLGWRSSDSPSFSVTAGGRIDASFNTTVMTNGASRGTRLDFGPFVRLAYNFGGPAYRVTAAAPAPEAPAAAKAPNHMVFFDFDRANLSPVAQATIRQAANDARNSRVARVQVTGHADRAGADAYNMALSLRRANTVKAELVQNGIAVQSILFVGRGEEEPLVSTGDGGREPQNRRVVISF